MTITTTTIIMVHAALFEQHEWKYQQLLHDCMELAKRLQRNNLQTTNANLEQES